ncbi:MAG: DUF3828 domain-containing protein [Acidobacteria bacterium]|nr:DUF3828 domain-containing protein [Acidobacteriota bacterium]
MKLFIYLLLAAFWLTLTGCTFNFQAGSNTTNAQPAPSAKTETNAAKPETTPAAENRAPAAAALAPDALLRDLYKTHDRDNGAIVQGKNRAIIDKYFDKNLGGLIWKDMTTNKDEVGTIDFDIFYNAQDTDINNLNVGAPQIDGDKARVEVTFENYKEKNTLVYSLVKENADWKIADIDYGKGQTLLKLFKEAK